MAYPDDNPKTAIGAMKPGVQAIPPIAILELGRGMQDGEDKYGRMNYRENRVTAATYYNGAMRHLMAWWDGEDDAPDSGVTHLGHAMANCAILLDAEALGKLNDDRPVKGTFASVVAQLTREKKAVAEADIGVQEKERNYVVPFLTPGRLTEIESERRTKPYYFKGAELNFQANIDADWSALEKRIPDLTPEKAVMEWARNLGIRVIEPAVTNSDTEIRERLVEKAFTVDGIKKMMSDTLMERQMETLRKMFAGPPTFRHGGFYDGFTRSGPFDFKTLQPLRSSPFLFNFFGPDKRSWSPQRDWDLPEINAKLWKSLCVVFDNKNVGNQVRKYAEFLMRFKLQLIFQGYTTEAETLFDVIKIVNKTIDVRSVDNLAPCQILRHLNFVLTSPLMNQPGLDQMQSVYLNSAAPATGKWDVFDGGGKPVYIAGPMRGVAEFNFPAFYDAEFKLAVMGMNPFNPARKDVERHDGVDISRGNTEGDETLASKDHGFDLRIALGEDTKYICQTSEAIALLPRYNASKGAMAEKALSFALGHEILYLNAAGYPVATGYAA